ncbi:MAG: hypothetical protein VXZ40_01355 [Nanoarchaeota archaeon]|nr:hypothetical protein [Nanoarchaeota archaeon]
MEIKMEGKKANYLNRKKLNELKNNLSLEESQIFNILSKNIFPKSLPILNQLLENIEVLDEKIKKKNRFSFKVTSELRNLVILKYLEVFPQSIQEDFHQNHNSLLR